MLVGKTTFFVANQANLEDMPVDKLKQLEAEHKAIEDTNKSLLADLKTANAGMVSLDNIYALVG
jgi:26S proteasome regulatory subunit, ATPase 3, interacting protein